ncbi:MAG: gamma-glutamyl-phosphate reductase, partial [Gammaproteobacteria bacterium]
MSATSEQLDTKIAEVMTTLGRRARVAAGELAKAGADQKIEALHESARHIRERATEILQANAVDMETARARNLSGSMLDRLLLDEQRIESMAAGVEQVATLDDPIGQVIADWDRPNGLRIQRVRVPLGVIGIIYESRPNVTSDAGALCLKSGNAVILRGGSESFNSSSAIHACFEAGLQGASLSPHAIQMVPTRSRDAVGMMLSGLDGCVDVIV